MKKFLNQINDQIYQHQSTIFWMLFFGLILLRIWLITGVPKMLIFGPHDDLFYARAAHSILRGSWMGEYTHMTLIKGPFYSFFMIGSFFTGLPLYFNETLFYIGACAVLFFAIKPLIKNPFLALLGFIIMLFLPSSMATWFHMRVYREFVYFSLTLYVVAFSIGLFLRCNKKLFNLVPWSIGLGISMGAFLLTREEGVWIIPVLLLFMGFNIIGVWRSPAKQKINRTVLIMMPIALWYIPILLISWLNYSHYGFWGVTENLDSEFNRVLTTLERIETDTAWHPAIQISQASRLAAYEVSPTLAQHQDMIESYIPGWNPADNGAMALKPDWYLEQFGNGESELGNGHFIWLMRDVAAHSGYYQDGFYPVEFYRDIADELEDACDNGLLSCKSKSHLPAAVGSIDWRHIPIITRMFFENIIYVANHDLVDINSLDINARWPKWTRDLDDYWVFEQFVYNPIDTINTAREDDLPKNIYGVIDLRYRVIQYKETIMKFILTFYKFISLPIFFLSLISWVFLLISRKTYKLITWPQFFLISGFVLLLFIARLMTLTVVDATTSILGIAYAASTHLFVALFSFFVLIWAINTFKFHNSKKSV